MGSGIVEWDRVHDRDAGPRCVAWDTETHPMKLLLDGATITDLPSFTAQLASAISRDADAAPRYFGSTCTRSATASTAASSALRRTRSSSSAALA